MPHRCDWMLKSPFGLMVHWLPPGPAPKRGEWIRELDRAVDRFDVNAFMEDFLRTGAGWLVFTIGQNTGMYSSPNSVFESMCGNVCSRRDLVMEIAWRVKAAGKRFIAYLPCEVHTNQRMQRGLAWSTTPGMDQREFQHRYTKAVSEWSRRLAELLDGWWFDGCNTWNIFNNKFMDWPLWYTAAREGNPNRAIAFNDGSLGAGNPRPVHPECDYLSGETEVLIDGKIRLGRSLDAPVYMPTSRFIEGTECQWHSLAPIDAFWAHGAFTVEIGRLPYLARSRFKVLPHDYAGRMESPIYSDAELASFLDGVHSVQGAVTFNAGIYQEGILGEKTVEQLQHLSDRFKQKP